MRLLIITQKIDKNDSILGFFHQWLIRFSEKFEKIIVICLETGEYQLPSNIKILSLGKESMRTARYERAHTKIIYIFNFYKYIWQKRNEYDAVFVHMNQEYVLLGGLLWTLLNKKVFLWRNHIKGNIFTRIAGKLSERVFYTSPFAYTAKFKNSKIMPVGIDTEIFYPAISGARIKNSILSIGRIDPVKNVHILIDALKLIDKNLVVNIYGNETGEYYDRIKKEAGELAVFRGDVPNYKTPEIYNQHEIFVNLTNSGSLDKTIFEAMACGCLAIVSNKSFLKIFPTQLTKLLIFKENDSKDLANKIINLNNLSDDKKEEIRKILIGIVKNEHSLNKLSDDLSGIISIYEDKR